MASVEKNKDQNWRKAEIDTLISIWAGEGIQEHHDYRVIHYFDLNISVKTRR